MTLQKRIGMISAIGGALLAASVVNATAAVICSGNVCWHARERYDYPPEARVIIHPDGWHWGRGERFTWREHEGRGYWRGDRWREW